MNHKVADQWFVCINIDEGGGILSCSARMFGGSIGGSSCWMVTFVVAVTIFTSVVADEAVEESTNSNITFDEKFKQVLYVMCLCRNLCTLCGNASSSSFFYIVYWF